MKAVLTTIAMNLKREYATHTRLMGLQKLSEMPGLYSYSLKYKKKMSVGNTDSMFISDKRSSHPA